MTSRYLAHLLLYVQFSRRTKIQRVFTANWWTMATLATTCKRLRVVMKLLKSVSEDVSTTEEVSLYSGGNVFERSVKYIGDALSPSLFHLFCEQWK